MLVPRMIFVTTLLVALMPVFGSSAVADTPAGAETQSTGGFKIAGKSAAQWAADLDQPSPITTEHRIIRLRAAHSLVAAGRYSDDDGAKKILVGLLEDDDAAIRYVAAVGLGDIGGSTLADANKILVAIVEKDTSRAAQMAAAYALCKSDKVDQYLPNLTQRLSYPERGMVCSAAELIGKIGPTAKEAKKDLMTVYEANKAGGKGDYHVGGAAKNALRKIGAID